MKSILSYAKYRRHGYNIMLFFLKRLNRKVVNGDEIANRGLTIEDLGKEEIANLKAKSTANFSRRPKNVFLASGNLHGKR